MGGHLVDIIILLIFVGIIFAFNRKRWRPLDKRYDERQLYVQGKAHRIAFGISSVGIIICIIEATLDANIRGLVLLPTLYATLLLSLMFYEGYCFINGAYLERSDRYPNGSYKVSAKIILLVMGILEIVSAIITISKGEAVVNGETSQALCGDIFLGVTFIGELIFATIYERKSERESGDEKQRSSANENRSDR